MTIKITNRAKRIGRAAVAARYNSERERKKYEDGKYDDTANVIDAVRAAQMAMDELLPTLQIAEIALDADNVAVLRVNASMIRQARKTDK